MTGGSSGIGFETARALVDGDGIVVIATRSRHRGEAAVQEINAGRKFGCRGKAIFGELDLSSFASVEKFVDWLAAEELEGRHGASKGMQAVVLNAGLFAPTFRRTLDRIEQTFQVNLLVLHLSLTLTA